MKTKRCLVELRECNVPSSSETGYLGELKVIVCLLDVGLYICCGHSKLFFWGVIYELDWISLR